MGHILQDLIERCIARNHQSNQRRHPQKTHVYQNEITIYYAYSDGKLQSAKPSDFADANLGIIPIAKNGYPIEQYTASVGKDWQTRYGFDDWENRSWKQSYGVQVYTGIPSEYLTDLDFEFDIVRDHPDTLLETLYALFSLSKKTCLTISKSGGIRFSCRSPDYVHPRSTEAREYIAKYNQETGTREELYLEIFGDKGLSRWDARYEIITGDLFDLPVIEADALLEIIENLKSKIHIPPPPKKEKQQKTEKQKTKKIRPPHDVQIVDGLPSDIEWIPTGETDKYKSKRGTYPCNLTKHTKSHGALQYYKDKKTSAIRGFCHNCREWQWIQKPKYTQKLSLKITGEINQTYVNLAENEQAIQTAFADVMAAPHSDKTRYLILTFEMGTGKNEVFLTSLATFQKKGILITENHLQVDQNVNRGKEFGLRGKGFRGRSYHFNDTPLSTMPIKFRQQNPDFFEKYDVVCLFYDQIAKRNKKGLAATPYCQVCPIKKECPYLHQFSDLSQTDLLVISAPDLFFDPSFWNLLRRLTTVETETMEEEIIGATFGLAPETKTSFDLGVVDEAKAINFYQGYSYQIHAFDKLAHAWEGELYGDFMSSLIEALGTENPYTEVQTLLAQLDSDTEKHISQQMTQVPIPVDVYPHILRNKDNDKILSAYYAKPAGAAEDDYENEWRIPISSQAEEILRQKNVPTLPYQPSPPNRKIGVSPYAEEKKGTLRLSDIAGRVWSPDWTLLDQLKNAIKIDLEKIGIRYTPKGDPINCDKITITVPPQVNPYVKNLVFMGGHADADNIIKAFDENESITWKVYEGKHAEYAPGVQTLQLLDARLTYMSIFEVEKNTETGQTIYDTDTNSPKIMGVKPFGIKILSYLCKLAEQHIAQGHPKPIFISWKEFTMTRIENTEIGKRMHACLEIGHFDNTRGLNYDGRKVFLKFGYPKARHDVIMQKAEILHHNDKEPLDDTYEKIDDIQEGYQATGIRRYKDPRMEAQRQQEIRDKAEQTVYRSRPTRWEQTTTIDFSAEPIPGWTERATGFLLTDFLRAESFEDIATMVSQREALTADNTIEDFQRIYICSYRQARNLWEAAGGKELKDKTENNLIERILEMHDQDISNRSIAQTLSIHESKVRRIVNRHK